MVILVNTQVLMKDKLEGIGWFTFETMKRICLNHPEHTFYFVFDRGPVDEFLFSDNVVPIILPPQARHPFLWFIRYEILFPFLIKKYKADLVLSPDGWMTLGTSKPCVQVLHDINFEHNPKDLPFWTRIYYRSLFKRYATKARRVVTVSQYSKNDISSTYKVDPDKIVVAHNGCNDIFELLPETINEETRQKYAQGKPFFYYVGALIPRKNLQLLFQAFDRFKESDTEGVKLLITGGEKWGSDEIKNAYLNMKYIDDVVFTGRQKPKELNRLYSASLALTFVPYFEGFGIPILEAFNCGTAVITSNCTSMPEVAGDAAILVDPHSVSEIANAMSAIQKNPEFRKSLIEKGNKRKELFSWDITSQKLWDAIEEAIVKA